MVETISYVDDRLSKLDWGRRLIDAKDDSFYVVSHLVT